MAEDMSTTGASGETTLIRDISFCGVPENGSNASMVDVKDGKIVRIRPMHYDWKYKKADLNPWKFEVRGSTFEPSMKTLIPPYSIAYKKRVYSPARIRYPMMRVDFDPNGERNPQNRGVSKYKRISWDEALDVITSEMNRIKEKYGPTALLYQCDQHGENKVVQACHGAGRKLLREWGGFTLQIRQPDSWEGWWWGNKHFWGCEPVGQGQQSNLLWDISKNAELLLFWGCDQETTPWGWQGQLPSRLSYWWSEIGIKQIYVCPDLNYAAAVHADRWIPVLPNTDAALYIAITHRWFSEGHLRQGVPRHPRRRRRQVRGLRHGRGGRRREVAGVGRPHLRRPRARHQGPRRRVGQQAHDGRHRQRRPRHPRPLRHRAGAPAGHLPRHAGPRQAGPEPGQDDRVGPVRQARPVRPAQAAARARTCARPTPAATRTRATTRRSFPRPTSPRRILEGECDWWGCESETADRVNQFEHYKYPADGCSKIHMVWTDSPSWITCWNTGNDYVKAMRHPDIEFMFAQHPWLENDCLMADVILPVNTKLEEDDIAGDIFSGQTNLLFPEHKCIEPLGESFSDYEIVVMLSERLGLKEEYTGGKTIPELIKYGYETSRCEDLISWEELNEKGYYAVPTDDGWEDIPAGFYNFYKDPEKYPLTTPTGKLEFEASGLAENFPNDLERPPVPKWVAQGVTHEETVGTERSRKYPLLVCSNHPRWSVHSQHDDITWLREIKTCKVTGPDGYQYHPIWLHPSEAEKRGIKDGDVVSIFNDRGVVLAGAYITERVMPGVIYIDHGAKWDPIVPGEIDRGGAINTIVPRGTTSKNAVGHAVSGFLADCEKTDMEELKAKYPEAFEKPFHPCAGPGLEACIWGRA